MIIRQMTASFGRLQNARLELGEGLNLIEAPNEAGKSTWSAFLRAMFYGVPTKERNKQGFIAEKNRYQPWSGAPMEGSMDLVWRGQEITLRRAPRGSTPFGRFEAVDTATGAPVAGLTGQNAGEALLGIPREVFERSAFVGQGAAVLDRSPALEKRIAALVCSGEEEVSASEVRQRLRDWQNRRRHNHTGLIPKLEAELEEVQQALERQAKALHIAQEAAQEVAALTREKEALEEALASCRRAENETRRQKYEAAQAALAQAEAAVKTIHADLTRQGTPPGRDTLRAAQEDLNYLNTLSANIKLAESQREEARARAETAQAEAADPCFSGMSTEDAWDRATADAAQTAEYLSAAHSFPAGLLIGSAAGLLAGAALAAALSLTQALPQRLCLAAGGALLLAGALAGLAASLWKRARRRKRAAGLLAQYEAQSSDGILERAVRYREKQSQAAEAEDRRRALEQSLSQMTAQREQIKAGLLELVRPFAPTISDSFGISAAISRALGLEEKLAAALIRLEGARKLAGSLPKPDPVVPESPLAEETLEERDPQDLAMHLSAVEQELVRRNSVLAMAQGELNALGDPAVFQARREALEEELSRRKMEYDALSLALEVLEQSDGRMQARFSPSLNQRAGEIMSGLTGGKYGRITLTSEFDASAEEAGAAVPRRALTLSKGTADQLYLAVRLAVCELALPAEDPIPLVLDDALTNFDDGRMQLALDYLLDLSKERQILLFTCHSREGRWLEGRPGVFRAVLQSGPEAAIMADTARRPAAGIET